MKSPGGRWHDADQSPGTGAAGLAHALIRGTWKSLPKAAFLLIIGGTFLLAIAAKHDSSTVLSETAAAALVWGAFSIIWLLLSMVAFLISRYVIRAPGMRDKVRKED